jgi:hypothetical protein
MPRPTPLHVTIPIETEALTLNRDLVTKAEMVKQEGLVIRMDVRRRNWRQALNLPRNTKVRWSRVHAVDVKELSSFLMPITYRVKIGEGYWHDREGKRHDFGVDEHLGGMDLKRGVTTVTLRAAVLLAVLACVGLRSVSWLLKELFHVEVSKSSLGRWIVEAGRHLPDAKGMVKRLAADRPISEAHLDEIFPKGWGKGCVVVVKDEHGRLIATEEMQERTKANVIAFLTKLKSWGLSFSAFYIDGCEAYRHGIPEVYPTAAIQYDYFHVIQNIWRHLWRAMVKHRKALGAQAKETEDPQEKKRLKALSKRLWKRRGLLFKSDERMTEQERQELRELMAIDEHVAVLRRFLCKVWGIFRDSKGPLGARQRLGKLERRPEVQPDTAYSKVVAFLKDRFDDMIRFLSVEGVKRNSLAESGIRCLRRLEKGHDGFRGTTGRDTYLRLYQAIRYCGWRVHRADGLLILPPATVADATAE